MNSTPKIEMPSEGVSLDHTKYDLSISKSFSNQASVINGVVCLDLNIIETTYFVLNDSSISLLSNIPAMGSGKIIIPYLISNLLRTY